MTIGEIRKKYLEYYVKREHIEIPSSAVVPENDPTTLFTSSGMQPLINYILGGKHPKGTRLVNSQKCFRAEDIKEVGDNRHTTFFEMLGNWSFGDYFKKEQLSWFFNFLVEELNVDPNKLYMTVFAGDKENKLPADVESVEIWENLLSSRGVTSKFVHIGSEEDGYARGMKEGERIFAYNSEKNWWSRAGVPENMPVGEPGGPDSELFYDFGTEHDVSFGKHCHPNCNCGRFMEIGNSVFMEYIKNKYGTFSKLKQQNVDFGGGLERIATIANDNSDIFLLDTMQILINELEKASGKQYKDGDKKDIYSFRIVADHVRGAVFMSDDGVVPSNKDQGYVLRRLIRRAVLFSDKLECKEGILAKLISIVIDIFKEQYPSLEKNKNTILQNIVAEEIKFRKTLKKGLREFEKIVSKSSTIIAEDAFILFTTHGFPLEITEELASERHINVDVEGFKTKMLEHQKISKSNSDKKFKGGLADNSDKTTALHTATHLMLAGLQKELGNHVHQKGSNITEERTRFDFTYNSKVERETLNRVEEYVNNAIKSGAKVSIEEMEKDKAQEVGVEGSFWEKYPDVVNVYTIEDEEGNIFSQELCGGPHVSTLNDIQGIFKIKKESSSSAGVRRIKAVLE